MTSWAWNGMVRRGSRRPRVAVVFSGGGARGAYLAGFVRYLREELPRALSGHAHLDILCGTSVGGLTACYLATSAHEPERQGAGLNALWTGLDFERVCKVHGESFGSLAHKLWQAVRRGAPRPEGWRLSDLFHPTVIEEEIRNRFDWSRLSSNLEQGHVSALSVTTTRVSDGRTVVFVQRRGGSVPAWSLDPHHEVRPAQIGFEHAMASAATPIFFRSIRIGDQYFCDGGLRQNTPLSPALHLGAEKVLIVSMTPRPPGTFQKPPPMPQEPTTPMLIGQVLQALTKDRVDHDLERVRSVNQLLHAAQERYGEGFVNQLNELVRELRGQPYRMVEKLVIRPSQELSEVAVAHARRMQQAASRSGTLPSKLLRQLVGGRLAADGELASYFLFDGAYSRDLIALGMEDAHARREELVRFFTEPADQRGHARAA